MDFRKYVDNWISRIEPGAGRPAAPWLPWITAALALLALGLHALPGAAPTAAPESRRAVPSADQVDALALRIAVLERRAAAGIASGTAGADPGIDRAGLALLALAEIVEAIERGAPFPAAHATLRLLAGADPAPGALDTLAIHAAAGIAALPVLQGEFARLRPMLDAQAALQNGSFPARIWASLRDVAADLDIWERPPRPPLRLAIDRIQAALAANDLDTATAGLAALDGPARDILAGWRVGAEARRDALRAVAALRRALWTLLEARVP
jgi:hypothetical protein